LIFLGFRKFVNNILTKEDGELIAQETWVNFFKSNKDLYLKNWEKYYFLRKIIDLTHINKKSRILDMGCGVSTILHFVEGKKWGIDPLAESYKKLYSYPKDIIIKKGVGEKIPFREGFFDVVFSTNSLDHTDNPTKTVSEIYRVLKPKAYFVLHVDIFKKGVKRDKTHPFSFTEKDCLRLLGNKFDILFKAKTNKNIFGAPKDRDYLIVVARKVDKLNS
jgi:ubiquinone/menaquinone biosynthesis C-methylase UbiE